VPKGKEQQAIDHKHHMKLQRDKELKRKERRNVELPAEYDKGKK
jgi:hypothetical protein